MIERSYFEKQLHLRVVEHEFVSPVSESVRVCNAFLSDTIATSGHPMIRFHLPQIHVSTDNRL